MEINKMIENYFRAIIVLFSIFNSTINSSVLISIEEQEVIDYKCDFEDRGLAESVRFIRSPVSCRVFHICAFFNQYTLTCPYGLYFDENLDTCNFESAVNCSDSSSDILKETTTSTQATSNETNLSNLTTNLLNFQILENTTSNYLNEINNSISNESILLNFTTTKSNLLNISTSNINNLVFINNQNSTSTTISLSGASLSTTTLNENFFKENSSNAWWTPPSDCVKGFEHRLPHLKNCGLYFECSLNGEKQEKACTYPLQYDILFGECRPYDQVDCGNREEAKDLCDYSLNSLNELNSNSTRTNFTSNSTDKSYIEFIENDEIKKDCSLYPSCKNLKDGMYPLNDCKSYFQCKDERTLSISNCPTSLSNHGDNRYHHKNASSNLRFNYLTQRCDLIDNVSYDCGGYAIPIDIYTNKMKCPNLEKHSSSLKQRYRYLGKSRSSFSLLEYKDLYFSHPTSCYLYLECNNQGEVKTFKCSNQTYFSPFYQMCVHPSISNCFKHYPLSSNLFPYLQNLYTINNNSDEKKETESTILLVTPIMANYRLLPNSNITTENASFSFKIDNSSNATTLYSSLNSTSVSLTTLVSN